MANALAVQFDIDQPAALVEISTNGGASYVDLSVPEAGTRKTGNLLNVAAGSYAAGAIKLRAKGFPGSVVSNTLAVTVAGATTQPAPTISGASPNTGAVGTAVTLTGTSFTGATAVAFNGTAATFTVMSATSINATVPTGATTGLITVTTPGGTVSSTGSFTVGTPAPVNAFVGPGKIQNGSAINPTPFVRHYPPIAQWTNDGSTAGGTDDGDHIFSTDPAAAFEIDFQGTHVGLIHLIFDDLAPFDVFVDSQPAGSGTQRGSYLPAAERFLTPALAQGLHTVRVQKAANAPAGSRLVFDAANVYASAGAGSAPDNVTVWGNSIVQGVNGATISTTLPTYLPGKTYVNKGVGGFNITQVRAKFDAEGAAAKVANARNVFVGFEGINTFAGASLDARGFADAVKSLCSAALAAGYAKAIWFGTTPRTIIVGTSNDSNPNAVLSNSYLAAELPALGVTYAALTATLIGKFGTAAGGQDAGYSSFGTSTAPSTINANDYFQDGTHPNARGMDIFARLIADQTLNVLSGTALPDRSTFGQAAPAFTGITGPASVNGDNPAWVFAGTATSYDAGIRRAPGAVYLATAGAKASIRVKTSGFTLVHGLFSYGTDYDVYLNGVLSGGVHVAPSAGNSPFAVRYTSPALNPATETLVELRCTGPNLLLVDGLDLLA